jgi:hypothetical protein
MKRVFVMIALVSVVIGAYSADCSKCPSSMLRDSTCQWDEGGTCTDELYHGWTITCYTCPYGYGCIYHVYPEDSNVYVTQYHGHCSGGTCSHEYSTDTWVTVNFQTENDPACSGG